MWVPFSVHIWGRDPGPYFPSLSLSVAYSKMDIIPAVYFSELTSRHGFGLQCVDCGKIAGRSRTGSQNNLGRDALQPLTAENNYATKSP